MRLPARKKVVLVITLRDYQLAAKAAVSRDFDAGHTAVGVSLPTGVGKSKIMASLVQDIYAKGLRSVTLLHRDTLVAQFAEHLAEVVPASAIGMVKAGKNDVNAPVIVASIHTLRSDARLSQLVPPHLTVVDEAHVSVSDGYLRYYDHVGISAGRAHAVGFTATWMRNDRRGLGDVWQKISYKRSLKWAVDHGHLVPPVTYQLGGDLDLSGVRIGADGDYTDKAAEAAVMVEDLQETVVEGYRKMATGRSAVLFAPTMESARYFGCALTESGVSVGEIFATTSKAARRYTFSQFDRGAIQVLITCTALAEGWDAPRCDAVLCVRPTRSAGMFVQQVGRALRPWPGKTDALVLDFVGVTDDKSIVAHIDLSETPESRPREESICRRCSSIPCECEAGEGDAPISTQYLAKKISGVHEVDLFAGTRARWLRTQHGVPFVATRESLYFLAQHDATWSVGRCPSRTLVGCEWVAWGLSSEDALDAGSDIAIAADPSIADKKASWRRGMPNDRQIEYALSLGIATDGLNKSRLSDEISTVIASRVLSQIGGTA